MKTPCSILVGAIVTLFLCQCSDLTVKKLNRPVERIPHQPIESHGNVGDSQKYHLAYQMIMDARSLKKASEERALCKYLEAAELAFKSRSKALLPLYNHSVGQAADLLVARPNLKLVQGEQREYRIEINSISRLASARGELSLLEFKDIVPSEMLKLKGWRNRVSASGVGASMVAHYQPNILRHQKEDLFINQVGIPLPVTVVVDFSKAGVARFDTHDTTVVRHTRFWGSSRKLSYDLTAPLAIGLENARTKGLLEDLRGVFYPVRYVKELGLYSVQKFDKRKTPLILVHGLVSDPSTWCTTLNGLIADPEIAAYYQVYFFYYPTGLPLRRSGSSLKKDLLRLQRVYHSMGVNPDRAVIVGHSMGGLLTSMQVRKFNKKTWQKVSKTPLKKAHLHKQVKADYNTLIQLPDSNMINRAVFIATPHRGSKMADSWVGRVVTSLIKIPQQALSLEPIEASRSLTKLGRTILLDDDVSNGVKALRDNNPALELVVSTPVDSNITYHSIIGDRGKGDTPNSSDGVVEYRSSHLKGAQSEKIVPSGHSAHTHPMAIKELRRILQLNIRRQK